MKNSTHLGIYKIRSFRILFGDIVPYHSNYNVIPIFKSNKIVTDTITNYIQFFFLCSFLHLFGMQIL